MELPGTPAQSVLLVIRDVPVIQVQMGLLELPAIRAQLAPPVIRVLLAPPVILVTLALLELLLALLSLRLV